MLFDVSPGADCELAGVVLGLADDAGDLVVAVVEDVVEQEDGALDRGEPFEQEQEGHRERVGILDILLGVGSGLIGKQWLGQPFAHVGLLADTG